MQIADREAELLLFWRAASAARRIIRNDPQADTAEAESDLDMLAFHTDWPLLKERVATTMASFMPPLPLDLSPLDEVIRSIAVKERRP